MRLALILWIGLCFPALADPGVSIAEAARAQVGVVTIYDPAYISLAFPGGDVAAERRICADVVICALPVVWICTLPSTAIQKPISPAIQHFGGCRARI
jgi:uncharacterized protein YijF (DUF1287 family)